MARCRDGEKGPLAMTRTGRSRLEHRHGWLDAGMAECPCSQDSNRTFEIRALPRMARRRDGEKGPLAMTRIS